MEIKDKHISIIGAKKSGVASAILIKKLGGIPFVSDSADKEKLSDFLEALNKENINFEVGKHSEKVFDCDFIVISPGVPSNSEVIVKAKKKNIKIISEIELASQFCKGFIIAITGSNGKTTTTSLIGHLLNNANKKCYTAGNIGLAFSEIALNVKENEFISLEVSSFQLDFIEKFKPNIAIILNITPDHLNRYNNNFEEYIKSKYRIFENQNENDLLILNADDETIKKHPIETKSKIGNSSLGIAIPMGREKFFSLSNKIENGCYLKDEQIIYCEDGKEIFQFDTKELKIKGEHNYANAMASIIVAKSIDCEDEKIIEGLKSFNGVEHRLELVAEINGVQYINDSKATNVDSVWYALRSFDNPIYLILGGLDKGNDYAKIKPLVLDKVKKIFAIGSSAEKIFQFFHHDIKVEIKSSLEECVKAANMEAREGDVILLSPACASFDMFENYEHRGKVFKSVVESLMK
ncbi:MAG: UDP-N-acetylmuramoyl-L-alanine--D-glutamate ligase [Ignavibacterium sp.]